MKKQNQQPSRFLGKVDQYGNIDAVLLQNDENDEKKAPEAENVASGPEPDVVEEDDAESEDANEPVAKENSGFWF